VSPTGLTGDANGHGGCKCRLHKKSQQGVDAGLGCWKSAIGKHPAIRAAEENKHRFCAASEGERRKDSEFERLCLSLEPGMRSFEMQGGLEVGMSYATGTCDIRAFGRGYCEFRAIYTGAMMRVARVLGPNPLVLDVLKVLCLVGRSNMKPLKVVEVSKGYFHVAADKDYKGMQHTAGAMFYRDLVEIAKKDNLARIGVGMAIGCVLQFGDAEPLLIEPKVDAFGVPDCDGRGSSDVIVVSDQVKEEAEALREAVDDSLALLRRVIKTKAISCIGDQRIEELMASECRSTGVFASVVELEKKTKAKFDWAEEVEREFEESSRAVEPLLIVKKEKEVVACALNRDCDSGKWETVAPRFCGVEVRNIEVVCGPNIERNRRWREAKKNHRKLVRSLGW